MERISGSNNLDEVVTIQASALLRIDTDAATRVTSALALLGDPYAVASLHTRALQNATARLLDVLPDEVLETLKHLRCGDLDLMVLSGLAVPQLPPEPLHGRRHALCKTGFTPEWCSLGILNYLGVLMQIEEEAPSFISTLFPDPSRANTSANFGYRVPLGVHTESGFLGDAAPHFVALSCLREDAHTPVPTLFADIAETARCLSIKNQLQLDRPIFALDCSPSIAAGYGRPLPPRLGPVSSGTGDAREFRFKAGSLSVPCHDVAAEESLRELEVAIQRRTFGYVLREGSLAIMSANRLCHGRVAYEASPAPEHRRWLIRGLATQRPSWLKGETQLHLHTPPFRHEVA